MDGAGHGGTTPWTPARQACVDLGAITGNVAALCERVRGSQVMAVVKADGYGHGMIPAARAALAGGATWLGTADLTEALALRAAGISEPLLCLMAIGEPAEAIRAGIDVTAASVAVVTRVAEAAGRGASRPGCTSRPTPGSAAAAPPAPTARGGRGRPGRPGRRAAPGGGPVVPFRLRRPARAPLGRGPAGRVRRRGRARREGGRDARGPAHRQHRRRADRARAPGWTWSGSAAPCTASRPCPAARRPGCARR